MKATFFLSFSIFLSLSLNFILYLSLSLSLSLSLTLASFSLSSFFSRYFISTFFPLKRFHFFPLFLPSFLLFFPQTSVLSTSKLFFLFSIYLFSPPPHFPHSSIHIILPNPIYLSFPFYLVSISPFICISLSYLFFLFFSFFYSTYFFFPIPSPFFFSLPMPPTSSYLLSPLLSSPLLASLTSFFTLVFLLTSYSIYVPQALTVHSCGLSTYTVHMNYLSSFPPRWSECVCK